ncbi:MAG: nucleotidyltransferase family protein [Elusimicrobia bacterium]|nr:nucleotidyltransferase family protein [Elusimicrobiota bacterium]
MIHCKGSSLALDSLQRLLKAKPMDQWGFVYHVDMPIWEPQLFQRLAGRAVKCGGGVKAVAPAYQGKGGHPVLLSPGLDKKLLALDPGKDRLDIWLKSQKIDRLEVPFPCVLENWNHLTALANIHSKE